MRLLDAEDLSSLRLGKFPLFDDAVYLQRQACLKKLLVGIGETKVRPPDLLEIEMSRF